MTKRQIYWLTESNNALHQEKVAVLSRRGYQVEFFATLRELKRVFAQRRVSTIVVGDEGDLQAVEGTVLNLGALPEMNGVRLILSISRAAPHLVNLAAANGFRDTIALDWESNFWLQRFIFSTAGSPGGFTAPMPQITLNAPVNVTIPARIVWVRNDAMWIETRVAAPVGSQLKLGGNIVSSLGSKTMTVTVEESRRSNLRYRFSDALIVRWNVPGQVVNRQRVLLEHLKSTSMGKTLRTFVAMQTAALRTTILSHLKDPRFEASSALQKHAIINEPKFFGPNIVIIEDKLTQGEGFADFEKMVASLTSPTLICIVGTEADLEELKRAATDHRCIILSKIPPNFADQLFARHGKIASESPSLKEDQVQISSQSDFSFASLSFPGRLTRLHPTAAQLAMATPLGNFGLCRIDSPYIKRTLGRSVFAKITDAYTENRHTATSLPYLFDLSLSDVFASDRQKMAGSLVETLSSRLLTAAKVPPRDVRDMESMGQVLTQAPPTNYDTPTQPAAGDLEDVVTITKPRDSADANVAAWKARADSRKASPQDLSALTKILKSPGLYRFLGFIAATMIAIWMVAKVVERFAENMQPSGSEYTEQLKLFKRPPNR